MIYDNEWGSDPLFLSALNYSGHEVSESTLFLIFMVMYRGWMPRYINL